MSAEIYKNKIPIFSIEGLEFSYKGKPDKKVLNGLNLNLYPGQSLGLRGANGSGKTTLFRCITGLEKSDAGIIRLERNIIKNEKDFYELRKQVGYVLQDADDQLFFPTVLEDISFGPINLGYDAEEARKIAQETLAIVGLSGFEDRVSWHLSGGEKKLVAIAAIFAMRPQALLLDEPLNELDENAAKKVTQVIKELNCAKIIISHDLNFLKDVTDEILTLTDGKLRL